MEMIIRLKLMSYLYIIPLLLALLCLLAYCVKKEIRFKRAIIELLKNKGKWGASVWIFNKLFPEDSSLYKYYSSVVLKYSKLKVERLCIYKLGIFISAVLLFALAKHTNIVLQTKEILTNIDYKTDFIYKLSDTADRAEIFEHELGYLSKALKTISKKDFTNTTMVQMKIRDIITKCGANLPIPIESMTNRVYYRVRDYYLIREQKLHVYILWGFLLSFTPEMALLVLNLFRKAEAKRELRFLKKLIILNGSIKPVDFLSVLKILIDKSRYYKNILLDIEESNRLNSINNKEIYINRIKNTNDLDEKLFFEKLDEANNYDFDQAIRNIENEFRLEGRDLARKIRKRIEIIHLSGLLGAMVIIVIMVMYLILPWLELYSMSKMGF